MPDAVGCILVQLHTSPPQVMPLPGQSVSLMQGSPSAKAVDALNSATEPTNVASEPRKKAFIRDNLQRGCSTAQRRLLGNDDRVTVRELDRCFHSEMRGRSVALRVE